MGKGIDEFYRKIAGKKVCVIGIGVSNTPLIKILRGHNAEVSACDKKTKEELGEAYNELSALGVKFHLGKDYLDHLDCDWIFKTPGLRFDLPQLAAQAQKGVKITSEMEVFFEYCPAKIIGVTGSDGKTTTTTLIYEMLKKEGYTCHLGGNIGKPLLPVIEEIRPDDMVIVELSSFQLQTMEKSPHIAVVTNVTPNHLDMHKSMEEYIEAKKKIARYQTGEDILVLNYDNETARSFASGAKGTVRFFSSKNNAAEGYVLKDNQIVLKNNGEEKAILNIDEIQIPGMHNVENYMAAIAAAEGLVSLDTIRHVAKNFGGVPHRIEFVREIGGVRFYNDSIASSPTRTIAGLRSFSRKLIVIAGGYDKKIAFDELGEELCKRAKVLVLVGMTAEKIRQAVVSAPSYDPKNIRIIQCGSLDEGVNRAYREASRGDVVTLSPACASFDQFVNFEQRGNRFKEAVLALQE